MLSPATLFRAELSAEPSKSVAIIEGGGARLARLTGNDAEKPRMTPMGHISLVFALEAQAFKAYGRDPSCPPGRERDITNTH